MNVAAGIYRPRCMVNGWTPIECAVHVSNHQAADTFSAVISIDDIGTSGILDSSSLPITIMASNDGPPSTKMFEGDADMISIDWGTRLANIVGRDKTSGPLDKKTNEKWINKQPQDIIRDLAQRSGLQVEFSGQSSDKAGRKYKEDYNRITELDSHWNVIVKMAKELGCIAYVKGHTLIIAPWDATTGGSYQIHYQGPTPMTPARGTVLRLKTSRNLQLAKGVGVKVSSWQHKEANAIQSFHGSNQGIQHNLKAANLTQKQADSIAQGRHGEITSHERTIEVVAPGDVSITPAMQLILSGTGTGADQSYLISDISHSWSWAQGYIMTIRGRNKNEGGGSSASNPSSSTPTSTTNGAGAGGGSGPGSVGGGFVPGAGTPLIA